MFLKTAFVTELRVTISELIDYFQSLIRSSSLTDDKTDGFFQEEFEIDLENEDYEKINVPDFRDGRRGRFIHDFNSVCMVLVF
jgi:hypothetical protein